MTRSNHFRNVRNYLCAQWALHRAKCKELFIFCAPALLVGLFVRTLMTWRMPYGYMQFDSADFLLTAEHLFSGGSIIIQNKRTYLVPLLYTLACLFKVPALVLIPLAQHLLGMGVILMTGLLTRLWIPTWRWVIVPVTLLIAANPNLLWFEHALMSECVYFFCLTALALSATLYARWRSRVCFALLLLALFLTAGARPEGRLLLGFGFLLVGLVEWTGKKTLLIRLAVLAVLSAVTLAITRTGQAGQLLYATVLPLAPDESKVDPGFGRIVRSLRDEVRAHEGSLSHLQGLEQKLTDMSGDYLKSQGVTNPDTNAFCQKLAFEACLRHPWALPELAARKFLLATPGPVSIGYDEPRLQEKLNIGFNRKGRLEILSRDLTGLQLRDEQEVSAFVAAHYHSMPWFSYLDERWQSLTTSEKPQASPGATAIPRLPLFFVLGLSGMGMLGSMCRHLKSFHIAWVLSLAGLWFAVHLTGVVNPRYRFAFEPFCLIYAILGFTIAFARARAAFHPRNDDTDDTKRAAPRSPQSPGQSHQKDRSEKRTVATAGSV